ANEKAGARRRAEGGIAMTNPYARAMAQFAAGLQYRAIPLEVRARIKLPFLAALGCALYGAKLGWCRLLRGRLGALDRDGPVGVFSAAAGAARGLRLDPGRAVHALGIAGTQAAGLMAAQYGAMVKRMHAGRASQSGLYGALLAEQGFTGIENVLESEYGGFCTTFSRSHDRFDLEQLVAGFGSAWQTMGIALKFYSCVGSNHTTLDALRDLQARK